MDGPVQHAASTRASPQRTSSRRQNQKAKASHTLRRAAAEKSDVTRRATKITASRSTLESLKRTHAARSSAADRPGSACSHGSSYSDSSFSTHQSESASVLADYYSVESLCSFDSGVESLDSMLWMGDSTSLLSPMSPTDADLAGPSSSRRLGDVTTGSSLSGQASSPTSESPNHGSSSRTSLQSTNSSIPLPPGWLMKTTPDGKPYFVNKEKRMTSWLDPRTNRPAAATQRSGLAPARMHDGSNVPLPEGWEMAMSENGVPYFIDHINRRTTWNDPRALMFEQQRETHRLRQLNQANADLRRKIEAIRKQQARLEQEMLRSASPEAIGLAKMKAQADAYAILTLQAQQDTLQRQIEASAYGRMGGGGGGGGRLGALHSTLPDVPEGEQPSSPTFLNELASVRRVASGGRKKRGSGRRGGGGSGRSGRSGGGIKTERGNGSGHGGALLTSTATNSTTPLYDGLTPSSPTSAPDGPLSMPSPGLAVDAHHSDLSLDLEVKHEDDLGDDVPLHHHHRDVSVSDADISSAGITLGDVDLSVLGVDDLPLSPTAVEDFFGSWSV
eukprot:m.160072 g.160072  ORF g.160072 m.160072 type:complete len:560 (-) comp11896_c0_seq1:281-1960(-)